MLVDVEALAQAPGNHHLIVRRPAKLTWRRGKVNAQQTSCRRLHRSAPVRAGALIASHGPMGSPSRLAEDTNLALMFMAVLAIALAAVFSL